MHTISVAERRRRLQTRHHLTPTTAAADPLTAARGVLSLHASDPASVYLSVLARVPGAALDDVATALYDDRSLVRLMAMRRTLFVIPDELVPCVHHAAAVHVAARLRRGIIKDLTTLPTDPAIGGDVDEWLSDVENAAVDVLRSHGVASALQVSSDEPRLRTAILPSTDKKYDVRRTINSRVLTLLGGQGRIVRGAPTGGWTSRAHTWEPAERWWPHGIDELDAAEARAQLAEHWLRAFGPATVDDLKWWTGWSLTDSRTAVRTLDTIDVSVGDSDGIVLADDVDPTTEVEPSAVLLPALDPTPMGWKRRDWYLGEHAPPLFDRNGNIGPTVWWAGRIIGGWAVTGDGHIACRLLEDAGSEAGAAVESAAADLEKRLDGAVVVPSFRTPLERELSG